MQPLEVAMSLLIAAAALLLALLVCAALRD